MPLWCWVISAKYSEEWVAGLRSRVKDPMGVVFGVY
jgi:hypothetical protein